MNKLKAIINFLNMEFHVTQFQWGRKLYGGTWYYIRVRGLSMNCFWSDTEIKSCQAITIKTESYPGGKKVELPIEISGVITNCKEINI